MLHTAPKENLLLAGSKTASLPEETRGFAVDSSNDPGVYDIANDRWDVRWNASRGTPLTIKGTISGVGTGTGVRFALANPFGRNVIVTHFMLDKTTGATADGTIDAGIAADATTSSDNLLDGAEIDGAALLLNNIDNKGTNGRAGVKWSTTQFLTIASTASLAGLVATYTITVVLD